MDALERSEAWDTIESAFLQTKLKLLGSFIFDHSFESHFGEDLRRSAKVAQPFSKTRVVVDLGDPTMILQASGVVETILGLALDTFLRTCSDACDTLIGELIRRGKWGCAEALQSS